MDVYWFIYMMDNEAIYLEWIFFLCEIIIKGIVWKILENEAIILKKQRVGCPGQCREDIRYCRYSVTEVSERSAEQGSVLFHVIH